MNLETLQKISAHILSKEIPEYKRYLYHQIDFSSKLIGIKGSRGTGKSTLLLQYTKQLNLPASKILYLSCDHPAMSGVSLYAVAESFYARGGKLLIIDEIHKSPHFARELKAIYDVFDLQVIFSGSSALYIEHSSTDLSRRAVIHTLGVLSLREFCELTTQQSFQSYHLSEILSHHEDIAASIMKKIRPLEQFIHYCEYGCYPFFQESLSDYPTKLLEVINVTIDSDLCGIYHIDPSKLDKLKKIIYMLCSSKPYEVNISKLSAAVGASWPTLQKYLERMDAGSLIHIVRGGIGMRALNRPDKLLLDNPNLFTVLCANSDKGALRESFFVSQVGCSHQVHYHDKGDFIADDIEMGFNTKIPLWLMGFLY